MYRHVILSIDQTRHPSIYQRDRTTSLKSPRPSSRNRSRSLRGSPHHLWWCVWPGLVGQWCSERRNSVLHNLWKVLGGPGRLMNGISCLFQITSNGVTKMSPNHQRCFSVTNLSPNSLSACARYRFGDILVTQHNLLKKWIVNFFFCSICFHLSITKITNKATRKKSNRHVFFNLKPNVTKLSPKFGDSFVTQRLRDDIWWQFGDTGPKNSWQWFHEVWCMHRSSP